MNFEQIWIKCHKLKLVTSEYNIFYFATVSLKPGHMKFFLFHGLVIFHPSMKDSASSVHLERLYSILQLAAIHSLGKIEASILILTIELQSHCITNGHAVCMKIYCMTCPCFMNWTFSSLKGTHWQIKKKEIWKTWIKTKVRMKGSRQSCVYSVHIYST